jgi:hypothetical protein
MPRDPRKNPLPGDALMTPNGWVYRVLDRFVAVNGQGAEHPGVYCSVENEEGEERGACVAMSVFLAKMAQADIIEQAEDGDVDWSCVARLPNDQVLPTMRRLHGYD